MRHLISALLFVAAVAPNALADPPKKTLEVTSTAFTANGSIPSEYTCDGAGSAPALRWSKAPRGTRSVAILVEDPDAPKGTFTHWLVTGIPATATTLATGGKLPRGATAAKNDAGSTGWTAPCPPSGQHHYVFHVYALDTAAPAAKRRAAFLDAINGHVLAEGKLVGVYEKRAAK